MTPECPELEHEWARKNRQVRCIHCGARLFGGCIVEPEGPCGVAKIWAEALEVAAAKLELEGAMWVSARQHDTPAELLASYRQGIRDAVRQIRGVITNVKKL